jgi:hypothetical protein
MFERLRRVKSNLVRHTDEECDRDPCETCEKTHEFKTVMKEAMEVKKRTKRSLEKMSRKLESTKLAMQLITIKK